MIQLPDEAPEFLVYRASYSNEYEVLVFNTGLDGILSSLAKSQPLPTDVIQAAKTYVVSVPGGDEHESREVLRTWFIRLGIPANLADKCYSWRLFAVINGEGSIPNYQGHPFAEHIDRTPKLIKRHMVPRDMFDPLAGMTEGFAFYS